MKFMFRCLMAVLVITACPVLAQSDAEPAAQNIPSVQDLDRAHSLEEMQLLIAPLTVDQLAVEAEEWQAYLQEAMTRIAVLKVQALTTEGEALESVHEQINEASAERNSLVDRFDLIIDALELKGGDPELVAGYRKYVTGALAAELQATDLKTIASGVLNWSISADGGVSFLVKGAMILGALLLLYILARLVRALASQGVRRVSSLSQLLQDFLLKVIFWVTFAVGLMIVLSLFGVNITPLFAVVGGASLILAFAMQETLGNLAAGLMIMVNKPFDVGDLIDTNGILGQVESVSIVSTTVHTLDNQVVILPNSAVWGSIITNVTVSPVRRVDMVFGIGYSDNIETAQGVLESLVREHPLVLDDPEPMIKVHELADSSVNFICRPWAKTEDYWNVYWDLTRQVKERFDAAGVSIPFPQRDVHLYQEA